MICLFTLQNRRKSKALLIAYNYTMIPIHNTSLGAQHSMNEVACFCLDPPDGNFHGENSGRPCRVLPRLALSCLVCCGSFVAEVTFQRTRSPMLNLFRFTLWLSYSAIFYWYLVILWKAQSLTSSRHSRLSFNWSSLLCSSKNSLLRLVIPISTRMTAFVP